MGTMKGLLIRILLVGVGGFLVVWLANSLLVPHVRLDPSRAMKEGTTSVNAATTSSVKTKATQESKGTKRAANAVSAPTSSTEDAALVERALEIPATSTVVREPKPFPLADQIAYASPQESITATYGPPKVSAFGLTDSHVMETFVYTKDQTSVATVIRLTDGHVTSAYTMNQPRSPRGYLVTSRQSN
jgi:hypothetical protein